MNKELLEIHSNVKDWLRFAEAKNAMLIAFNGASIYGVAKLPFWCQDGETDLVEGYLYMMIILLGLSTVICLISFVPRIKFMLLSVTDSDEKNNIFFFEHLAKITPLKIIEELKRKGVVNSFNKLDEDIAVQIHQLSAVASRKYGLFTVAVWVIIASYFTPVIAILAALYVYKK